MGYIVRSVPTDARSTSTPSCAVLSPASVVIREEHAVGRALGLAAYNKADGSIDPDRPGLCLSFYAQLAPGNGIIHATSREHNSLIQTPNVAWNVVRTRANHIRRFLGVQLPPPDFTKLDLVARGPIGIIKIGTSGKHPHAVLLLI